MASPDTIIGQLLIVDYHPTIGGKTPVPLVNVLTHEFSAQTWNGSATPGFP